MILINIGDELLLGQVINTNAAFIGQQMALAGIEMTECVTIGDDGDAIRSTIENGLSKTNLLIVTRTHPRRYLQKGDLRVLPPRIGDGRANLGVGA